MGKAAMKKAMKKPTMKKAVMKKAKAMKTKRVTVIARGSRARSVVFSGRKEKTQSGLMKADLVKTRDGKIVSKKASAQSKKRFANSAVKRWAEACKKARKELGITGFVAIGGKSEKGKALYAKVKSLLK